MKQKHTQIRLLLLFCLMPLALAACSKDAAVQDHSAEAQLQEEQESAQSAPTEASSPDTVASGSAGSSAAPHTGNHRRLWSAERYTPEDYALAMSFCSEGYQDKTVAEFDRSVMDWENEESYHKMEDTLKRLYSTLPEEDENAGFLLSTLSNTWDACEKKHYHTCAWEKNPWHSGHSQSETFGDIYGDKVCLTGAYADFGFDYQIADETAITVGERDTILDGIAGGLSGYLASLPEEKLRDEDAMERELQAELEKLLNAMEDNNLTWAGSCHLSYYWNAPWENEWEEPDDSGVDSPAVQHESYTQEQYDYVLSKLQYDRHEDMTVAEFDRLVNSLFTTDEEKLGDFCFYRLYDLVCSGLSEDGPKATFLFHTVPMAMDEYNARVRTVYSGKPCDPSYYTDICLERTGDVFGDEVPVSILEASYTLTYRILDADSLTVGQRNQFLEDIQFIASKSLQAAMEEGEITESTLENAVLEAGREAGSPSIALTGCEAEYLYDYKWPD